MTTALSAYRLGFADWLTYPDDGRLYEIVTGELYVTPPPNVEHQRISRDLEYRLLEYLRRAHRGEVFDAPIGVHLSDENVLEPDLVVVLAEHADRIGKQAIEGAPDLVVEILSPGTAQRDVGPKLRQCERARVPEYWVVDPKNQTVEVLVLEQDTYVRRYLFGRADNLVSPLLDGLAIDLTEIFRS
jgi:Uma2 family endonuclease